MKSRRCVALTGGAGTIATGFARIAAEDYDFRLIDLPGRFDDRHESLGRLVEADLRDIRALDAAFAGVDTVIHLGGERSPSAPWATLLPTNVIGTYNVVTAAIARGCRRVIFASSVHAVSGYDKISQIRESDSVRPADLYGVTKCFGEALGAYAAVAEGLSFIALRIGAFQEPERLIGSDTGWMLPDYCAPDDLYAMLRCVIESEGLSFEIYNAVSANRFGRLSMEKAREHLGFQPRFDSFELSEPFRNALAAVGGIDDKVAASGMREELAMLVADRGD